MAGIQDVAKKAGVSIGTVSRVLNQSGYASEKARKKVEQAVRELQYKPNELARNLLKKQSNIVAIIVPDISSVFFAQLVSVCELELREAGYKTMICNTNGDRSQEKEYLEMLNRNLVDGILTCTHSLQTEGYKEANGPVVSFDTVFVPGQIPRITVNHKEGGGLAAKEFLRVGCKKVLQFRDQEATEHFPFMDRHEVFEETMQKAGVKCENIYVKWNEFADRYFQDLVRDVYSQYPDVDGVFGTDALIIHFMRYVQRKGKRIPEDIRFVAYDGTNLRDMIFPTLTCIRQPIKALAKKGVEILLNKIQGSMVEEQEIVLPVELIQGMSTMTVKEKERYLMGK